MTILEHVHEQHEGHAICRLVVTPDTECLHAELTTCRAEQARLTHHATAQVALLQGEIATLRGLVSGVTQTPAEKLAEMERTYYSKGYDRGQRDTCRGCHNCGGALTAGTTHNGPALVCEECHERDVYCEQLEAQVTTLTAALRRLTEIWFGGDKDGLVREHYYRDPDNPSYLSRCAECDGEKRANKYCEHKASCRVGALESVLRAASEGAP